MSSKNSNQRENRERMEDIDQAQKNMREEDHKINHLDDRENSREDFSQNSNWFELRVEQK
jgi:hypothetical protein